MSSCKTSNSHVQTIHTRLNEFVHWSSSTSSSCLWVDFNWVCKVMLLIYYNFVVIICGGLWMTLVCKRSCCKIFICAWVSKNLSNNLRILLIKGGWIKNLSLSLGHFLTIINIIMRNLMGGLRSSMAWCLLTFVRSNSVVYGHIVHSIAD